MILAVAAVLLTGALALALSASSHADWGGVATAAPAHRHDRQHPPLAIGDSTMLRALCDLAWIGYQANAHGCRQFPEALALLRAERPRARVRT